MGESMVDTPKDEIEREEPGTSESVLNVSVSFGRFENDDSLSWERWSSFSPNKYLEEVGKCSTPGSVAKKKAYFEAHYKKIAARNAELLEQNNQMEDNSFRSDEPNSGDLISNGCGSITGMDPENAQIITEERDLDTNSASDACTTDVDELDEPNKDSAVAIECQSTSGDGAKEKLASRPDTPKSNISEVAVLVEEENHSMGSQTLTEMPERLENEMDTTQEKKVEDAKLNLSKESQKRTPAAKKENSVKAKENSVRSKKKPASPIPKSPQISTPRASKPTPPSTAMSASRTSTRKGSRLPLPRSGNPSAVESKRSSPFPLHMSLSLEPSNSDSSSLTTTRRSFIMENMGDKEIVKRAFKTFQNSFNQLKPAETNPSSPQQVTMNGREQNDLASLTLRKDKDGVRTTVEKASAQGGQVSARRNSVSARPLKEAGANQKNTKVATSPSFSLKSDERAEKRREFFKKLEEKSNAKEVERTHLQSKSKEQKEAEIKKLRQSLNFKATPMPDFYREQGRTRDTKSPHK